MPHQSARDVQFLAQSNWCRKRFVDALATAFTLRHEALTTKRRIYYDTADFQLGLHGLAFYQDGSTLSVRAHDAVLPLDQIGCAVEPTSVTDVPDSRLRQRLVMLIEDLPLTPVCQVRVRTQSLRILDQLGKTTVRLIVEEHRPVERMAGFAADRRVWIHPLTGYRKAAKQVAGWCGTQELVPTAVGFHQQLLGTARRSPGKYSAKRPVRFGPEVSVDRAVRRVLRLLLAMLRYNESGMRRTDEAVYVHDFRVAVRRARALIGQTRSVFPAAATEHFRKTLTRLGRMTSDIRDLDAFILAEDAYTERLSIQSPQYHAADGEPLELLQQLYAFLRQQRRDCHRRLTAQLEKHWYRAALEKWQALAAEPAQPTQPVTEVKDFIHERVLDQCRALAGVPAARLVQANDEELHALRIDCKKVRYLIDSFIDSLPDKPAQRTLKRLKRVQRRLGAIQDLSVQQVLIGRFQKAAPELAAGGHAANRRLAELHECLRAEKRALKEGIPAEFEALTTALLPWLPAGHEATSRGRYAPESQPTLLDPH